MPLIVGLPMSMSEYWLSRLPANNMRVNHEASPGVANGNESPCRYIGDRR